MFLCHGPHVTTSFVRVEQFATSPERGLSLSLAVVHTVALLLVVEASKPSRKCTICRVPLVERPPTGGYLALRHGVVALKTIVNIVHLVWHHAPEGLSLFEGIFWKGVTHGARSSFPYPLRILSSFGQRVGKSANGTSYWVIQRHLIYEVIQRHLIYWVRVGWPSRTYLGYSRSNVVGSIPDRHINNPWVRGRHKAYPGANHLWTPLSVITIEEPRIWPAVCNK